MQAGSCIGGCLSMHAGARGQVAAGAAGRADGHGVYARGALAALVREPHGFKARGELGVRGGAHACVVEVRVNAALLK